MKKPYEYIEMKIPAKAEYVGVIRLTVSGIASRMGFSYEDIEDIKIALSEATTNAILHAYNGDVTGEIIIGFCMYQTKLELVVTDKGKSFDPEKIQDSTGPYTKSHQVKDLPEGGLGLFLIETLMDKLVIQNENGVIVNMTKFLERDGVEDSGNPISTSESR